MRNHLKDYFIPHKNNDHKPHFLRKKSLAFIVSCLIVVEIAFIASTLSFFRNSDFLAAVLPSVLVSLTNENRTSYKVTPLAVNPLLTRAAELKAEDMAARGYFAHTSPDGVSPWYWLDLVGYSYFYAGENLAVNFFESKDVSDAWMKSPAHKDNVVNKNYSEIGIATARGMYKGREATFVVEFFGEPAYVIAKTPPSKASSKAVSTVSKLPIKQPSATNEATVKGVAVNAEKSDIATQVNEKQPFLKLLESPRSATATVILAAIILLLVALALAVLIKIKIQHPKMIAGTLLVILIALGILYLNSKTFVSITELPTDTNSAATEFSAN